MVLIGCGHLSERIALIGSYILELSHPHVFVATGLNKVQKILRFCGDVRKYVSKF